MGNFTQSDMFVTWCTSFELRCSRVCFAPAQAVGEAAHLVLMSLLWGQYHQPALTCSLANPCCSLHWEGGQGFKLPSSLNAVTEDDIFDSVCMKSFAMSHVCKALQSCLHCNTGFEPVNSKLLIAPQDLAPHVSVSACSAKFLHAFVAQMMCFDLMGPPLPGDVPQLPGPQLMVPATVVEGKLLHPPPVHTISFACISPAIFLQEFSQVSFPCKLKPLAPLQVPPLCHTWLLQTASRKMPINLVPDLHAGCTGCRVLQLMSQIYPCWHVQLPVHTRFAPGWSPMVHCPGGHSHALSPHHLVRFTLWSTSLPSPQSLLCRA